METDRTLLVAGGAGYLGSTFVAVARAAGRRVVVLDDLSAGHRDAVPADVPFVEGDIADGALVAATVAAHRVTEVVHFAARIEVGESVRDPARFWERNVVASFRFVEALRGAGVTRLVFSSTAAVYGVPTSDAPLTEELPLAPMNPYGATKLAVEHLLTGYEQAYGLRSARLRYFNAAGALPDLGLGERHDPETHLLPNVLAAATGRGPALTIFGDDFPTEDGTCVRDYVHVADLADAHLRALDALAAGAPGFAANLGTGRGATVRAVIAAVEAAVGRPVPVVVGPRRAGDPPRLVASPARAEALLGWRPTRPLPTIVADAYRFFRDRYSV